MSSKDHIATIPLPTCNNDYTTAIPSTMISAIVSIIISTRYREGFSRMAVRVLLGSAYRAIVSAVEEEGDAGSYPVHCPDESPLLALA